MKNKRVILRIIKRKDYNKIIFLLDKDITKWINPIPYPPKNKDLIDWLDFLSKANNKCFVIIEKNKANIIGMIWVENITKQQGEIGFWIAQKFQGKGYMKRAGNLLINYAKEKIDLRKLKALTTNRNLASQKTLESLGFILKQKIKKDFKNRLGNWCDVLIYEKKL